MTFTASFAGAAGTKLTALTPPFTLISGTNDLEVDGAGQVRRTVTGTAQTFYGTYNDGVRNQNAQFSINNQTNAAVALLGSASGGLFSGYYVKPQTGMTSVRLWKVTAGGAPVQLAASSAIADCQGLDFSVTFDVNNIPTFVVKRGTTQILSYTDNSSPFTSGQRGLLVPATAAITAGGAWTSYKDSSANTTITLSINERVSGYPFEGLAGPPAINVTGVKAASNTMLERQVELEDGTIVSAWSTAGMTLPTTTSWRWDNTTLPMRTDGKEYRISVRDQANPDNMVTQANTWRVAIVIPYNDQSLDDIMSNLGKSPSAGAMTSVTANQCSVMYATTPSVANSGVAIARLNAVGNYGSGLMQMADEIGRQVALGNIPNYPITFVNIAVSGQTMTDWNADAVFGNWTLLQFMTYMLAQCGGRISALLRSVVVWSSSPASAITAMNQIVANVEARLPNQPAGYTFPIGIRGGPRATRTAGSVLNLRTVCDTLGLQGGRYFRLTGPVLDMQLEGASQLHQATGDPATTNNGATAHIQGNRRLGFRQGRGGAAFLQMMLGLPITIKRFGPTASGSFKTSGKTAIVLTYDRDIKTLDGSTTAIPQFYTSTDNKVTWTLSPAAITGARNVEISHPSGTNWTGQTVHVGYVKDSPYGDGDDTNATALLAKLIYDAAETDADRQMVAMADDILVTDASTPATVLDVTLTVQGGNTITRQITINP